MLMANVLAKLDATRKELETEQKDLKRLDNLLQSLLDQRADIIIKEIAALECKIMELEDELDG